jgi:hypothetical protein
MPSDRRRTANRHPELAAEIRRIVTRFGMNDPLSRGPVLCRPRDVELMFYPHAGNPRWSGHNSKICFATRFDADSAAEAISQLPGADRVASYPCPRAAGEHFHHVSAERRRQTVVAIMDAIADAARRHR